jgi:hypothetical protein
MNDSKYRVVKVSELEFDGNLYTLKDGNHTLLKFSVEMLPLMIERKVFLTDRNGNDIIITE